MRGQAKWGIQVLVCASIVGGVLLLGAPAVVPGQAQPEKEKAAAGAPSFKPVPLPDPHIPGFRFPEPEATILNWVGTSFSGATPQDQLAAQKSIHLHAWGIWTALTADSGEKFEGQALRVYDTWYTPADIVSKPAARLLAEVPRAPRPLGRLRQFRVLRKHNKAAPMAGETTVLGFVKYDPSAAEHLVRENLFQTSVLDSLIANGQDTVAAFPVTAVALKPVYAQLPSGKRFDGNPPVMVDGRYYPVQAWPGPPSPPTAFPSQDWMTWVWIDVKGGGQGNGAVVKVTKPGPPDPSTIKPGVTYPVDQWIHFSYKDASDVRTINNANKQSNPDAPELEVGDYAVLTGMHVTSREITRWTWQTFWWQPDPDNPPPPSSRAVAGDRPSQLKGAPRHYACAPAYSMVLPQQPNVGGQNAGESVYAYNPYLEAPFGPTDLPASIPGKSQGKVVANDVGVQTNCMSCHAMASYVQGGKTPLDGVLYTGDRYVDLQGPQFSGHLKTDFLWSIPDVALFGP
jgi:hypothetical protein